MSGTNNVQNGRQPPLPNHPPPPFLPTSTSRTGNEQKPICRKFVWGTCVKSTFCKFRHELDLEEMKKILKFCHDYQNKQGCVRDTCTYLHTSREEEDLFLTTGQFPRVLAERYAALSETSNSVQNFEGVPQMKMFVTPPPPPPPPAPMMVATAAPPPPPPPQAMTAFPSIQQPPPPPPPTQPSTTLVQTPPVFTGLQPRSATPMAFPINQPPPSLPPMFDASRPPPPIPAQSKNAIKRRMDCEAGPSKVRIHESSKDADGPCENCVQRELRVGVYKQEMDKVVCELKYQRLVYQKRLKEYESGKDILRALVSPELYRVLEEYIEGGPPQIQDILAQYSQNPIVSFMEYMLTNSRNVVDSTLSPSLRLDDSLPSLSRINNPINASPGLLHSLIQVLRNSNIERESINGQKDEGSVPITSTSSSITTRTPVQAASAAPAPAPAPLYPAYHPAVPPPTNRPYYPQPYTDPAPSTSTPMSNNVTYNNTPSRIGVSVPHQMSAQPSTSAAAPSMPSHYSQYMMGRYPHPPQYYPPYQ